MSSRGDLIMTWSDGAARGNPGPAGIGARATDEGGRVLKEVSEFLGETTSNVAEYHAFIAILEAAKELGFDRLRAHMDSVLVANQVVGAFKVKSRKLTPLVARARTLLEAYSEVEVVHVPREKNTECDALANRAIDEGLAGLKKPLLTSEDEGKLF